MKKFLRILHITLSIFIVLILLFIVGVGNYLYNMIINASTDKSEVLSAPHNNTVILGIDDPADDSKSTSWFQENAQDNYIYSFDELKLHSYIITNKNATDKWVILCHGYDGNALRQSENALCFYDMGFNILAPDARGHGKSEGNYIGMGWHDRLDVVSYIERILDENKNAEIALYGASMGGATIMMACGEDLPTNVKVAIEDCGYSSAWEELSYQLKKFYNLPEIPFLNCMSLITRLRAGYLLEEANALKQVSKCKIPILFIHGSKDTFVPPYMVEKLYNEASCPKEKLIVDNAGHVQSSIIAHDLYWSTIKNFLIKYVF